jgi:hypothetical protein
MSRPIQPMQTVVYLSIYFFANVLKKIVQNADKETIFLELFGFWVFSNFDFKVI